MFEKRWMKKVSIKALQSGLMAILLFGTEVVRAQGLPILTIPTALGAFDEPLEPIGAIPSKPESDAIRVALDEYVKAGVRDTMGPLELYLRSFPDSPWRASLRMNMGLAYKRAGWPGKAMANFEDAWRLAKADEGTVGRRIADRAVSEWMWLCVKAGDDIRLENLLREVGLRPMFGGCAQRRADAARALYAMQKESKFYLCGPTALATVNLFLRPHRPVDPRDVKDTIPGVNGTSLFQLGMMAYNWDIPLQMLKRSPGAKVLTPSVVHWKVGHWAAVLREAEGRYLVQEDVLEEAKWVSRAALDEETSGYCLAPFVLLPEGWSRVSAEEGKNVWGRGRVGIGPWFGPYPNSAIRPQLQPAPAVAQAGVRMGNLSLEIWFAPLSVPRPDGPAWPFEIRFQQRLARQPDRPAFTHIGAHWTATGVSYLEEEVDFERQDIHLYTETGACLRFTGFDPDTGRYDRNLHTRDVGVQPSS